MPIDILFWLGKTGRFKGEGNKFSLIPYCYRFATPEGAILNILLSVAALALGCQLPLPAQVVRGNPHG